MPLVYILYIIYIYIAKSEVRIKIGKSESESESPNQDLIRTLAFRTGSPNQNRKFESEVRIKIESPNQNFD